MEYLDKLLAHGGASSNERRLGGLKSIHLQSLLNETEWIHGNSEIPAKQEALPANSQP
jgi:hypothetical protein